MTDNSQILWNRAQELIPGGVNSPVRSFKSVGGNPFFVERGEGPYLYDTEGRRYTDYVLSWGPLILGHAHPVITEAVANQLDLGISYGAPTTAEIGLAERIVDMVPGVEMVRLVNSGTEATMSALRLARAFTGRDIVIKFSGCYHGHADPFLVSAGSGVATLGLPDSPGVPEAVASQTAVLPFNDFAAVENFFDVNGSEVSSVFVEPVVGNSGLIPPMDGFLQKLRLITERYGALLMFDEVMTGFRVAMGGAQERYDVLPDLTTLGKVIGGGLPVGAFGGRRDIMENMSPSGPVYQAGTLSGNPLATAAGSAQLDYLKKYNPFQDLEISAGRLVDGIVSSLNDVGIPTTGTSVGSMWGIFFCGDPVYSFEDAQNTDIGKFQLFHRACLNRGVFFAPSPFEAGFVSIFHTRDVIDETIEAVRDAALEIS